MVSTQNPFPGMNPYLEKWWPDVHTTLIAYIKDEIAASLPRGLVARAEERINIDSFPYEGDHYRSDVAVSELWKAGVPPAWTPESEGGAAVAEPEILVLLSNEVERWLEIRSVNGKVVTCIEILSPANKLPGHGRDRYLEKQKTYLESDANLVVIDLLRCGHLVIPIPNDAVVDSDGIPYHVCVARASRPDRRELYRIPLRRRLPAFRVPLRPEDRDVVLDLQPLLDRCYERGGYWQQDYSADPQPPLDAADRDWLDERLREAGLRAAGSE